MSEEKIGIVRIRGVVHVPLKIKETLRNLRLLQVNSCVIVKKTPSIMGMVKKVKDYVTYGEIDQETEALLNEKRSRKTKDKEGKEVVKPFFRLHPPKGGFERKGIKRAYAEGGALGYRKNDINTLIKKMI
jgi:large subunit ribosomal protein L30